VEKWSKPLLVGQETMTSATVHFGNHGKAVQVEIRLTPC